MLSAAEILRHLRTREFGRSARVVSEAPSTIDIAWEWASRGAPHGAVVIAGRQTAGRGRLGRSWASPAGGLWMSVVTRTPLPVRHVGRVAVAMAIASAEACREEARVVAGLKWPNDLVLGDKKVGGVLAETRTAGEVVEAAVVSVGLNVNVTLDQLPPEVLPTATSLRAETGREYGLGAIAARVLEALEALWPSVCSDGKELVRRWNAMDTMLGVEVEVVRDGNAITGTSLGLGEDGELLLEVEGRVVQIGVGEVRRVRRPAQ